MVAAHQFQAAVAAVAGLRVQVLLAQLQKVAREELVLL
jgi:hypothetical protein